MMWTGIETFFSREWQKPFLRLLLFPTEEEKDESFLKSNLNLRINFVSMWKECKGNERWKKIAWTDVIYSLPKIILFHFLYKHSLNSLYFCSVLFFKEPWQDRDLIQVSEFSGIKSKRLPKSVCSLTQWVLLKKCLVFLLGYLHRRLRGTARLKIPKALFNFGLVFNKKYT